MMKMTKNTWFRTTMLPLLTLAIAMSAGSVRADEESSGWDDEGELDPLSAAIVESCCNTVQIYVDVHEIHCEAFANAVGPVIQTYANLGLFSIAEILCETYSQQLYAIADAYCSVIDAVADGCLAVLDAIDAPYDAMDYVRDCASCAKDEVYDDMRDCMYYLRCRVREDT